jgi:hypothetical protein
MMTIHNEEGGLSGTSGSVQFQAVTLFVWIGAFALLIASVKHAREGHLNDPRLVMPVIHLVPWCIALLERRRIRTLLSLMPQDQSLIEKVITRVLWTGYVTLALVEYWLY